VAEYSDSVGCRGRGNPVGHDSRSRGSDGDADSESGSMIVRPEGAGRAREPACAKGVASTGHGAPVSAIDRSRNACGRSAAGKRRGGGPNVARTPAAGCTHPAGMHSRIGPSRRPGTCATSETVGPRSRADPKRPRIPRRHGDRSSPGNPGEDATVDRQVSLSIVDRAPSLPEAFGLVNMRTSFKFG
jgi:hypothetical protein